MTNINMTNTTPAAPAPQTDSASKTTFNYAADGASAPSAPPMPVGEQNGQFNYGQSNYGQSNYGQRAPQAAGASGGFSIAALTLGAASLVLGWTFFIPIVGIVLGSLALRREPNFRTMAKWGIALNAVALLGTVLAIVVSIVFGLAFLPFLFLGIYAAQAHKQPRATIRDAVGPRG